MLSLSVIFLMSGKEVKGTSNQTTSSPGFKIADIQ